MDQKRLLLPGSTPDALLHSIRISPAAPVLRNYLRTVVPDLKAIPHTTYTRYREFEFSGEREGYQKPYFARRSMLTRAVVEFILGDESCRDDIHDLLWSICEETSWVLPAHEEQGPDFWDLKPSPRARPWGTNTALTREPDAIDLFAAETGAALAETIYLLGDRLAPEVVQRVRQEVERHIFKPYLAYGRQHWWFKGALNWNGVCNGSIGLAFLRLEKDPQRLAEALEMVLEGFAAYIATGFEPDGGSIEGPGYWSYGLMYYVTLAEALAESTCGALDLLAAPRLKDIVHYQVGMALSPGTYINFGDATEQVALQPGIIQRLAERTGVADLRGLVVPVENLEGRGVATAKTAIILRDLAWWDGQIPPFPASAHQDFFLPDCAIAKFCGQTVQGQPVILAAKAGHNDGHHSHTDIGQFVVNVAGESLLCDPGRGLYSREYFRKERYQNFFNNSLSHSVPRIGGQLQMPGPEFGGTQQYHGKIVAHEPAGAGDTGAEKSVVIDIHPAYALPELTLARRRLALDPASGAFTLEDQFEFSGAPLEVEEAFVTWCPVEVSAGEARIQGQCAGLHLQVVDPPEAVFVAEDKTAECRANRRAGVLTRLAVQLPPGCRHFSLKGTIIQ